MMSNVRTFQSPDQDSAMNYSIHLDAAHRPRINVSVLGVVHGEWETYFQLVKARENATGRKEVHTTLRKP